MDIILKDTLESSEISDKVKTLVKELAKELRFMVLYVGDHHGHLLNVKKGNKAFVNQIALIIKNETEKELEETDIYNFSYQV